MSTVAEIKSAFQKLPERDQWKLAEWIQGKLESFETLDAEGAKGREPVSAVAARAQFIVAYDPDLLDLENPYGIACVTPRRFLSSVRP